MATRLEPWCLPTGRVCRSICSSGRPWPARRRPPPPRSRPRSTCRWTRPLQRSSTWTTPSCREPASSTSPAGCTGASSSRPATSSAPLGSRPTSGWSGVEDPEHVAEARELGARLHRRPHGRGAPGPRRGDLRRGDGAPDLARHPGAGPAPPRPGPAGVAGHRRADRDRPDHRPPARADRRDGHRGRARGRRLHRQAGRRHAARPGQGRGDQGAGRARGVTGPQPLLGLLRLLQRPADALPGGRPVRDQPGRQAACARARAGVADPRLPDRAQGRPDRPASWVRWPER